MANKIMKSVSVTFYDGSREPKVELSGPWTRRDIDAADIAIRRYLPKYLADQRAKDQKEKSDG
jgi:hypothetical protein